MDFSVIIPAKNEEKMIGNCLESIKKIDYPKNDYEVIIADNGSTDNTINKALKYNVQIADMSDKKTISAVRNGGANLAVGDILVFLDADCSVSRDWLKAAAEYIKIQNISCFGSPPIIPDCSTWVEKAWYSVRKSKKGIYKRNWQESTNMFIPKTIFDKVGGFDEELSTCEDVDLSYRLLKHGDIIADTGIVAVHHRDPKNIVQFFLKERWRGKSNYLGVIKHGFKASELPSLLLPVYYVILPLTSILLSVLHIEKNIISIILIFWQLPILALTILKIKNIEKTHRFIQVFLLYNIYFLARAMSIFKIGR